MKHSLHESGVKTFMKAEGQAEKNITKGQISPQELEEGRRSGPYLLENILLAGLTYNRGS